VNVISTGLDYSARRLSGASIRAAGYRFVNRYLWFPGQRWPALTADEYRDLTANGVEVHAIYEQNTSDPAGGWNAGVTMARQAVQSAQSVGLPPGSTIYMCADAWLATHGIAVSTAMSFLDGARSVLGSAGYLTGAYGFRDFVYAAQDGGHADRFWLCGAESGVRPGIHQYQWNNGRVYVDGLECDLNKQYLPMFDGHAGGGGGAEKELEMGTHLCRGADTGRIYLVTLTTTTRSKWYVPNPEIAEVVAGLMGASARNVPDWYLDYIGDEPGTAPVPVDVDEEAIAKAVSGGVIPAVVAALQGLELEGLTFKETVEAVREALRTGTNG
jgi:hypothetical protein